MIFDTFRNLTGFFETILEHLYRFFTLLTIFQWRYFFVHVFRFWLLFSIHRAILPNSLFVSNIPFLSVLGNYYHPSLFGPFLPVFGEGDI